MAEIGDRVHKIEEILYGNEFTKEKGLIQNVNDIGSDVLFFKRFVRWFSFIFSFISACVLLLLGIGVKYNIDLIKEVSTLSAMLIEHMGKK